MDRMFRLGILGATGTARKRILPALEASEVCNITAIQGRNREQVEELAELFELEAAYTDVDDLLTHPGLDGVYIASPPFLHLQQIELALMHGLPVLVEKPLCNNVAEADRIVELAEKADVPVAVAHHLRVHPALPWVRSILGPGKLLGGPTHAHLAWTYHLDRNKKNARWKTSIERNPAGVLADVGVHLVDFALALFGEPRAVAGRMQSPKGGVCESHCGLMEYDGFSVHVFSSWRAPKVENSLQIWCEKGFISVGNLFSDGLDPTAVLVHEDGSRSKVEFKDRDMYEMEVEEFCIAARNKQPVLTTVKEARTATIIMAKMLKG